MIVASSWFLQLTILRLWDREFAGYSVGTLIADLVAGVNVGVVSLPLALAFGVASGATAGAGLVTAIISGVVMGALGGAPLQVSGPTGAMAAILAVIAATYGLSNLWIASLMAGCFILLLGLFRMGRLIRFVPSPVVVGFTSGIALVIASGQVDNVLGLDLGAPETSGNHLRSVIEHLGSTNLYAVGVATLVIVTMVIVPRIHAKIPGSFVGIVLATVAANLFTWPVSMVGIIPTTIFLPDRLMLDAVSWSSVTTMIGPAISIAVLASMKSLLCGTVGAAVTGIKLENDQELIALGLGNMVLPFFGGVSASAAVARTSVAVRSGGRTRLVPIIHGLVLLAFALLAAPLLERIPLSALGGVLLVTSVRVNDWETIRFFIRRKLWHAVVVVAVTIGATYTLNLTQAIFTGLTISVLWSVRQASVMRVSREAVDPRRMEPRGARLHGTHEGVEVVYVAGSLYFGNASTFLEALEGVAPNVDIVLSLRGMPTLDAMGVQAFDHIIVRQSRGGGSVHLAGIQPAARRRLERSGILAQVGAQCVHWSADQAISAVISARNAHVGSVLTHDTQLPEVSGRAPSDDPKPGGIQKRAPIPRR